MNIHIKKMFSCIILLLMCFSVTVPVWAEFVNPPVIDNAGYLDAEQFNTLTAELNALREKYNFDVAVYTEEVMSGEDETNTADDIFDYNGYGAGSGKDGIMLYVSSEPRKYRFTTHGTGLDFFNSRGLAYLESKVLPCLQDDDYNGAFEAYAEYSAELLEMAAQGEPYNKKSGIYIFCVIAGAAILPLIIASAAMNSKLKKMKTAVKQDYASNYMKPGSFNLTLSQDIYLYSTVTKTERPKDDSDSHTSSSGETHGGCGGSY